MREVQSYQFVPLWWEIMTISRTKTNPWQKRSQKDVKKLSDNEINEKYEQGERRILLEINREKLPSFADSLKKPNYMETRPFYQRRDRWDAQKQSRLIESFLMNIPVPPLILYETSYNSYEVMDGQQRITAIENFYNNKLQLTGLEIWPELEGRTYKSLPAKIKDGINRRVISTIVVITESLSDPEESLSLKQLVFERLNTGGVSLSRQEIRNCLYSGKFNELLLKLSENTIFAKAWDIPINDKEELKENGFYKKMEDVELILRFFALRDIDQYTGNLSKYLDNYMMKKSLNFSDENIQEFEQVFNQTIELVSNIYQDQLFKPFDSKTKTYKSKAYKVYYDAVMISFSNHLSHYQELITKKSAIIDETISLFTQDSQGITHQDKKFKKGLFTGEGDSKDDFKARIQIFDSLIQRVLKQSI
ncbi:DUF262 domain-containing protein [Microcystis wesenbergii FACHB-1317]|uniref:GmrSD restriction endonuclease domain-containing protein n=1 Tax=Microcystis TaxID=1125 RepID=UPI0016811EC1|nr:DUF262 domain-containing protein [Microcystis aeruginosa]MBD2288550.1 DUF262 domain-containing protein [Microcystis wesenbergii FACHB-1317]